MLIVCIFHFLFLLFTFLIIHLLLIELFNYDFQLHSFYSVNDRMVSDDRLQFI
jgi:hypothetical protein